MKTKAGLEAENRRLSGENGVLHAALNDVLNGEVLWTHKGVYSVGISRATQACGGIVLVKFKQPGQRDYTCAYRWDDWFPTVRDYIPSTSDKDALALREAALKAHVILMREQAKAIV